MTLCKTTRYIYETELFIGLDKKNNIFHKGSVKGVTKNYSLGPWTSGYGPKCYLSDIAVLITGSWGKCNIRNKVIGNKIYFLVFPL